MDDARAAVAREDGPLLLDDGFELLVWPRDPRAGNSFGSNPTSLAEEADGAVAGVAVGGFGLIRGGREEAAFCARTPAPAKGKVADWGCCRWRNGDCGTAGVRWGVCCWRAGAG